MAASAQMAFAWIGKSRRGMIVKRNRRMGTVKLCRASGFEKDSNLVNNGRRNAAKGRGNNRPSCKPFTTENQFKDAQSNLVNCKENKHLLDTQGHGNMIDAPHGASL